jgi:glycosyltransferase involved in cell wall biosynthesis
MPSRSHRCSIGFMDAESTRRVLMTADTVGGVFSYALELIAALNACEVSVALATMGAPLTSLQRAQIERLDDVSLHESRFKLEWMDNPWRDVARAGDWLLELSRALRPDVVHLNQLAFGSVPFAAPTLVVAHSCVLSWWRAVHREAAPRSWDRYRAVVTHSLESATLVAAPTRSMLQTLADNYGYEREGVVLPNARHATSYLPADKAPFILAAGRLWDEAKNLAALEAVAPHVAWPVYVAGSVAHPDGGTRKPLGVTVLGELAPQAMAQQLARAAIYALPARYEPFGLSALEAGLARCALVLGDIPTLREVWGEAALYVEPDDHQHLRETLARLIANPKLRDDLAHEARERALIYTPQRMVGAYCDAYATLTGRAATTRTAPSSHRLHLCAS